MKLYLPTYLYPLVAIHLTRLSAVSIHIFPAYDVPTNQRLFQYTVCICPLAEVNLRSVHSIHNAHGVTAVTDGQFVMVKLDVSV